MPQDTIIEIHVSTDRSDTSFAELAAFVDKVRLNTQVPDAEVVMAFDPEASDHEVAVHAVDLQGDWNRVTREGDSETVGGSQTETWWCG